MINIKIGKEESFADSVIHKNPKSMKKLLDLKQYLARLVVTK